MRSMTVYGHVRLLALKSTLYLVIFYFTHLSGSEVFEVLLFVYQNNYE